jgi:hypothetical protein
MGHSSEIRDSEIVASDDDSWSVATPGNLSFSALHGLADKRTELL